MTIKSRKSLRTNGAPGRIRTCGLRIRSPFVRSAESLGNVRKHNQLIGFSANRKAESLGKIRNRSGRHLGDSVFIEG